MVWRVCAESLLNLLYSELNARVEFQVRPERGMPHHSRARGVRHNGAASPDLAQVRFKWGRPNSVAIWDNRLVLHSIVQDVYPVERRGYRVTITGAEEPFYNAEGVTN